MEIVTWNCSALFDLYLSLCSHEEWCLFCFPFFSLWPSADIYFFISFLPSLSLPFLPLPLLLSTSLYFFLSLLVFKSLVLGLKRVSVAGIYNDVIGPWRSRLRHYFQLCTVRSSPLYFLGLLFLVFNIGHCDTIVQPPEALLDGAWVIHVFCSSLPCMQGDRDWLAYTCTFLGLMEGYLYL